MPPTAIPRSGRTRRPSIRTVSAPSVPPAGISYAYFPFGGGPRQCIGKNLALLETHLTLAMLLQRFRFELEPGRQVKTEPEVSLRLKGGLWMRLKPA